MRSDLLNDGNDNDPEALHPHCVLPDVPEKPPQITATVQNEEWTHQHRGPKEKREGNPEKEMSWLIPVTTTLLLTIITINHNLWIRNILTSNRSIIVSFKGGGNLMVTYSKNIINIPDAPKNGKLI